MLKDASNRLFHDVGVTYEHGIETHRIQWYVIMKDMDADKDRKVDGGAKYAQQLYDTVSKGSVPTGAEGGEQTLWRELFDRDMTLLTGSSPETFMNYIRANAAAHFPQLNRIFDVAVGSEGPSVRGAGGGLERFHQLWIETYARQGLLQQLQVFPNDAAFRQTAEALMASKDPNKKKEVEEIAKILTDGLSTKMQYAMKTLGPKLKK